MFKYVLSKLWDEFWWEYTMFMSRLLDTVINFFTVDESMGETKWARPLGILLFIAIIMFTIYYKSIGR